MQVETLPRDIFIDRLNEWIGREVAYSDAVACVVEALAECDEAGFIVGHYVTSGKYTPSPCEPSDYIPGSKHQN